MYSSCVMLWALYNICFHHFLLFTLNPQTKEPYI